MLYLFGTGVAGRFASYGYGVEGAIIQLSFQNFVNRCRGSEDFRLGSFWMAWLSLVRRCRDWERE